VFRSRMFEENSRDAAWRMVENKFVGVAVSIVIAGSCVSVMRRAVSRLFLDRLVLRSLLVDLLAWGWALRGEVVLVDWLRCNPWFVLGKTSVLRFQALVSSRGWTAWRVGFCEWGLSPCLLGRAA